VGGLGLSACLPEARFVQESPSGGVVAYSIENEGGILASVGRNEAIGLIEKKCPNGYRLIREGEIPRLNKKIDQLWRGQMTTTTVNQVEQPVWGLEFNCK